MPRLIQRHQQAIENAAAELIAVADDSGKSLVDVIAEMERYIIKGTKVGDAREVKIPDDRRGYTLTSGRLVEVTSPAVLPRAITKRPKAVGQRR